MGFEVRRVGADDPLLRPLIDDLARDYDARYAPTDGVPSSAELTRYPPEVFAEAEGGAFLAVLDGDELVAGGALKRGRAARGEVKRMWTRPGLRRQGLAARVLRELEAVACELGYADLELTTGARQPEAVALYLRHGWIPDFDPSVAQPAEAYLRFTKAVTAFRQQGVAPQ